MFELTVFYTYLMVITFYMRVESGHFKRRKSGPKELVINSRILAFCCEAELTALLSKNRSCRNYYE
jgi:hypothetical protein